MKIKDFIDYEQPNEYIVESDRYSSKYSTPVLTAGQSFILGYTNESKGIYKKGPCIIFDDFTTSVHYVDFPFKVKSSAMKILTTKSNTDLKYCYYLLLSLSKMPPNHKRQWISTTSEKTHELPSMDKQIAIVKQLDLISDTIAIYTKQIENLDNLVKARFIEMFGDPIINSKKLPTKSVINVVTLQRGYDLPNKERHKDGIIPLYGANGQFDWHDTSKACHGIITGRSGSIGQVYYCETEFWPLNTTLFSVNIHGNNIIYLSYLLDFFDLKRFSNGTGVPTLNRNLIHKERIIDVPLKLQNQFADFVRQVDKSNIYFP